MRLVSLNVLKSKWFPKPLKQFKDAERHWLKILNHPTVNNGKTFAFQARRQIKGLTISQRSTPIQGFAAVFLSTFNHIIISRPHYRSLAHEVVHACQNKASGLFQRLRNLISRLIITALLFPRTVWANWAYKNIHALFVKQLASKSGTVSRAEEKAFLQALQKILHRMPKGSLKILKKYFLMEVQAYSLTLKHFQKLKHNALDLASDTLLVDHHKTLLRFVRAEEMRRQGQSFIWTPQKMFKVYDKASGQLKRLSSIGGYPRLLGLPGQRTLLLTHLNPKEQLDKATEWMPID